MKKLNSKRKIWLTSKARKSDIARRRELHKKRLRRGGRSKFRVILTINGRRLKRWAEHRVPMPSVFCLHENYVDSTNCLRHIGEKVLLPASKRSNLEKRGAIRRTQRVESYIDLSMIKEISPSAALVLASEYDRLRSFYVRPNIPVVDMHKWSPVVADLLSDVGVFELLDMDIPHRATKGAGTIQIARFESSARVGNPEALRLLKLLAGMIIAADEAGLADPEVMLKRSRLFDALVEATENSLHHAYPTSVPYQIPHVGRWWMTAAVRPGEKHIWFAVYDQGVSIPASLPNWSNYPWVARGLRRLLRLEPDPNDPRYDGERIHLAMTRPRSSTGRAERGKGFPVLKSVVDQCTRGRLTILSRGGRYVYQKGERQKSFRLEPSFPGTLIEWDLWL